MMKKFMNAPETVTDEELVGLGLAFSDIVDVQGHLVISKDLANADRVTIVTYGSMLDNVLEAAQQLSRCGIEANVIRLLQVSQLSAEQILEESAENAPFLIVEEACTGSGIREALAWELRKVRSSVRVEGIDLGDAFVPHGSQEKLYERCGLDPQSIADYVKEMLS